MSKLTLACACVVDLKVVSGGSGEFKFSESKRATSRKQRSKAGDCLCALRLLRLLLF